MDTPLSLEGALLWTVGRAHKYLSRLENEIDYFLPSESREGTLLSDAPVVNMQILQMEEPRLLGVAEAA